MNSTEGLGGTGLSRRSLLSKAKSQFGFAREEPTRPLTRKEMFDLAAYCREYAHELARYDQNRVNLKQCYRFNAWLPRIKAYDLLQAELATLKPARPIARWQVMIVAILAGLVTMLAFSGRFSQLYSGLMIYGIIFSIVVITLFVPERVYGTTIELLEGKLLRIVESLEPILLSQQLGFSEAAFFRVRDDLNEAKRELRQQIDLAHRRWR